MNTDGVFTTLHNSLMQYSNGVGSMVGGVVAIGGLIYLGSKVWPALAKGEPIDFYPLLKPFFIGIFCLYFSALVITPVQYVLSPVKTYASALGHKDESVKNNQVIQQKVEQIRKERDAVAKADTEKLESDRNLWQRMVSDPLKDVGQSFVRAINDWLYEKAASLVGVIYGIMIFIFKMLRIVFLCVLNILGPIAFALAVFPGFHGNIVNWLAKYVSIYLWLPIVDLIVFIVKKASITLLSLPAFTNEFNASTLMWLTILLQIIGILTLFAVPTISTWIVQGGESGGAMRGFSSAAASIGGYAGAKAGGAGQSAIGGAGRVISAAGSNIWQGTTQSFNTLFRRNK